MKHTGGVQNLIYEYENNSSKYILRVSDALVRNINEIKSELDFILHLYEDDISVAIPIISQQGKYIESIEVEDKLYYVTSFIKATGNHINYPDYLNNFEIYYQLCKLTGKLHKSSKEYKAEGVSRGSWKTNYYMNNYEDFLPQDDLGLKAAYRKLIAEINKFPKSNDDFGLIHGDINVGNFFVDDKKLTLFDFDECQYSWYVEDIAIQLFYTVYVNNDDSILERNQMAIDFMQHFLKGYKSENHFDTEMIKRIPEFLILREMIVHVGMYKKWDMTNLNGWAVDYLRDSADRIRKRIPIVKFDSRWCDFL